MALLATKSSRKAVLTDCEWIVMNLQVGRPAAVKANLGTGRLVPNGASPCAVTARAITASPSCFFPSISAAPPPLILRSVFARPFQPSCSTCPEFQPVPAYPN